MTRGIYGRKYNVVDVAAQANKLTHILYAFANLQEDGQVVIGVSEAIKNGNYESYYVLTVYKKGSICRQGKTFPAR